MTRDSPASGKSREWEARKAVLGSLCPGPRPSGVRGHTWSTGGRAPGEQTECGHQRCALGLGTAAQSACLAWPCVLVGRGQAGRGASEGGRAAQGRFPAELAHVTLGEMLAGAGSSAARQGNVVLGLIGDVCPGRERRLGQDSASLPLLPSLPALHRTGSQEATVPALLPPGCGRIQDRDWSEAPAPGCLRRDVWSPPPLPSPQRSGEDGQGAR